MHLCGGATSSGYDRWQQLEPSCKYQGGATTHINVSATELGLEEYKEVCRWEKKEGTVSD